MVSLLSIIRMLWLAIFALSLLFLNPFLPDRMTKDSDTLSAIATFGEAGGWETGRSYANHAAFFRAIPSPAMTPFLALVGTLFLWLPMRQIRSVRGHLISCALTMPTVVFSLIRPQKETIVAMVVVLVMLLDLARLPLWLKALTVLLVYLTYAYFFRTYYVLVAGCFVAVLLFRLLSIDLRALALIAGLAGFLIVPADLLWSIQAPRDDVNIARFDAGSVNMRSAFLNPYPPSSATAFAYNYGYAFLRLKLPILFDFGLPEIALTLYSSLAALLCLWAVSLRSPQSLLLGSLFLAHDLTLILFEPDLGSYFRHLSSVAPYLLPGILALDQRRRKSMPTVTAAPDCSR